MFSLGLGDPTPSSPDTYSMYSLSARRGEARQGTKRGISERYERALIIFLMKPNVYLISYITSFLVFS